MTDEERKKKKKKERESELEKMIFQLIEKGLKAGIDQAMDDIFKDWK